MFRLIACLALLGAAANVHAQPAAPGGSPPAVAPHANAMRLAQILSPEDKIAEASDHAFRTGFRAGMANDPDAAAMFEEHPALLEAIFDGASPLVRRHIVASVPDLQQRAAKFYAERFTPSEIEQLIGFYESPTGAKLVAGMYAGIDMSRVVEAVGPDGTDQITGDEVRDMLDSTSARIMPAFNQADWKAIIAFGKTPVFGKIQKVMPEMMKFTAEIANEPSPEFDAELEQLLGRIVADYFAGAERAATSS